MIRQKWWIKISIQSLFCFPLTGTACVILLATVVSAAQPNKQAQQNECIEQPKQTPCTKTNQSDREQLVPGAKSADSTALDPTLIESLLKQQFKVIKPEPSSSNPFPTLVSRSNNGVTDPLDAKYAVLSVNAFDDKGFFHKQKILLITVNHIFLEQRIKVFDRSVGMFALAGNKLIYLNGNNSAINVAKVLKRENRSLSQADPQMLAQFFAKTILRQANDRVDVVETPDDILKLDKPSAAKVNEKIKQRHLARMYATTVDKAELQNCADRLIKPQLSFDASSGWKCRFIGLRGFMHTIRVPFALVEYIISVSRAFDIKVDNNVLSAKIIV